ncbi:MAG: DUF983 domain-containing protein [Alphaproteobacteria bacterium]|nr:DUF983 domain-containing protein [Alphaproteobacteria bacterium]
MFRGGFTIELRAHCEKCGLDFTKNDSADGPAVFLIFILGFSMVPIALVLDSIYEISLLAHAILWTIIALILTVGSLKPLKSYIIALQYKHRPGDWDA